MSCASYGVASDLNLKVTCRVYSQAGPRPRLSRPTPGGRLESGARLPGPPVSRSVARLTVPAATSVSRRSAERSGHPCCDSDWARPRPWTVGSASRDRRGTGTGSLSPWHLLIHMLAPACQLSAHDRPAPAYQLSAHDHSRPELQAIADQTCIYFSLRLWRERSI